MHYYSIAGRSPDFFIAKRGFPREKWQDNLKIPLEKCKIKQINKIYLLKKIYSRIVKTDGNRNTPKV